MSEDEIDTRTLKVGDSFTIEAAGWRRFMIVTESDGDNVKARCAEFDDMVGLETKPPTVFFQ